MTRRSQRIAVMAIASLAAAGLAACSSSSNSSNGGTGNPSANKPVIGGTLKLVAASGPDHIDTVPAYYTADYIMERAYARQLLAYPTVPDPSLTSPGWKTDTTPVADMATEVPTTANGGISSDNLTYTFHIKPGVDWNTNPARQVTASDFLREFKAFCNPAPGGFVGQLKYYSSTIKGLSEYCDAETAYFANPKKHAITAANVTNFQNTHNISGITVASPSEIQFHLIQPASDFLYMMAMPFTSARPVEYDSYLPNSLQLDQHTISDGPYQITSYVPGKSITLGKNPAWKQSTDNVRHQYLNTISLTIGVTSAETQLADMKAGTYDMVDDTAVEPTAIPGLLANHDPKFKIWPWDSTLPYVVFNLRSPNSNGAMGNALVRQAIEYGLDKVAVQKAQGGPLVSKIINTVIPPGNVGYQNYNLYPNNNGQGDTAKCKADLAKAGFKNGVSLTYLYANDSVNTRIFTAIQASLKPCGVNLVGKAEPGSSFFVDLGNAPVNNRKGTWDVGQPGWIPDWFGNNGRTVIGPLFETNCVANTNNYGCYTSKKVDGLIAAAEKATSTSAAGSLWHQADEQIMKDAVIVPLGDGQAPFYSSARVQNKGSSAIIYAPNIGGPDITNVWINPNAH
ncbi:MAG TPA: ABC transporter substrate-binding protein [Streptosporangiaceae bacterium]|jgi:peptide/nickel transport system substrate-binding protein|nr:ABC transporter substrate-binding protein [Streptosporangiaceae bacterium]